MFSRFNVKYPRTSQLYSNIPQIETNQRNVGQDRQRRYQEEFTIFHVTKYDVLVGKFQKRQLKLRKIISRLEQRGVYSQFRFMLDWTLYKCQLALPEFVMLCSFVALAYINFQQACTDSQGNLKSITYVQQIGVPKAFNIPWLLQNLLRRLSEAGVHITRKQLETCVKDQIVKNRFVIPEIFKKQVGTQCFESQKSLLVFLIEKKFYAIGEIANLTLQIDHQKTKMNQFMFGPQRLRIVNQPIGRKSAPVTTGIFKLWRRINGKYVNTITGESREPIQFDSPPIQEIEMKSQLAPEVDQQFELSEMQVMSEVQVEDDNYNTMEDKE